MLWFAYFQTEGFPDQRIEATVALSGSAVCQTHGAKIKASDLLPRYLEDKPLTGKAAAAAMNAWAKAHNRTQRK